MDVNVSGKSSPTDFMQGNVPSSESADPVASADTTNFTPDLHLTDRAHRGHIVILVENLPVPFDRRVWLESLALKEAGYRVSVVSPCPPDDAEPNRVIEGVRVYRYPMPSPSRGHLSFVREFAYCYWQTRRIVKRIWRNDPFDVIHSCNPPDMFWALARPYKKKGVRFVFDHHDVCPELYLSKFGKRDVFYRGLCWLEKRQFAEADVVIATNESYRRIAIDRGGKHPRDVTVVRSGPQLSRFQRLRKELVLKQGRKHLCVYLGVMGKQDGVDYALRAIRNAINNGLQDTLFAFIGDGDHYEEVIKLSCQLSLQEHVIFTGRISDEVLCSYLSTADLALAPDPKNPLNDISTMNKVVEYMSMSLPIISFDLKETRFSAGDAAVYIPDNDVLRMGHAIIEILKDPIRREIMGLVGRKRVESMLSWDHSRECLIRLYDQLLENKMQEESFDLRLLSEQALAATYEPPLRRAA